MYMWYSMYMNNEKKELARLSPEERALWRRTHPDYRGFFKGKPTVMGPAERGGIISLQSALRLERGSNPADEAAGGLTSTTSYETNEPIEEEK